MKKAGYHPGYAAGVITAASIIGSLIPPSTILIIIGELTETSILRLWFGGVVPGLLLAALLAFSGYIISKKRKYPKQPKASFKQLRRATGAATPALLIPVVILGGMRLGFFTPTEAGAVAVLYVVLIGLFLYKKFTPKQLWRSLGDSTRVAGGLMFAIAFGVFMATVVQLTQASEELTLYVTNITTDPVIFLLAVATLLFIAGFVLDILPITFVFAPMLAPVAASYGIDLVQFGVVFAFSSLVAGCTPPVSVRAFMVCDIAGCTIEDYVRDGWPFIAVVYICLIILVLIPSLTTWFPNLVMGLPIG